MFRTKIEAQACSQDRFDLAGDQRYGSHEQGGVLRRLIPWLVALAITAAALLALAEGYFA